MKLQLLNGSSPIVILMATYNGGLYLEKQIQSIISQSYTNWQLIIRDDGSVDNSIEVIKKFKELDSRVKQIITQSTKHGSCANFSELYSWVKTNYKMEYLMFCDQDDIWLSNKIEVSLNILKQTEQINRNAPCLVYGRLHIMDELGHELKEEINYTHYHPQFNNIIIQNPMFGCTMMINKELIDLMAYIPNDIENHDYWVALIAVFFGRCTAIQEKIILYRQHINNVSSQGASFKKRFDRYFNNKRQVKELKAKILMLSLFYNEYCLKLNLHQQNVMSAFLKSFRYNSPLHLIFIIIKHKIFKITFLQTFAFFYILIFNFKKMNNYIKYI